MDDSVGAKWRQMQNLEKKKKHKENIWASLFQKERHKLLHSFSVIA